MSAKMSSPAFSQVNHDAVQKLELSAVSVPLFSRLHEQKLLLGNPAPLVRLVYGDIAANVSANSGSPASDLSKIKGAPPTFLFEGKKVVFTDIQSVNSEFVINAATHSGEVKAKVSFVQTLAGHPVIDLVPGVKKISVDGALLSPDQYREVLLPDGKSKVRIIDHELAPGPHTIEMEYDLPKEFLKVSAEGIRFSPQLDDLIPRKYNEQYLPSNLEYDQYPSTVKITIRGGPSEYRVVSNGEVKSAGRNSFSITTPADFNAGSLYLDLHPKNQFHFERSSFQSRGGKVVPIIIYSDSEKDSKEGMKNALVFLKEFEERFGAYFHASFTARILEPNEADDLGMEYNGATVTQSSALRHEILHSWFGRGAKPQNYNAAWLDEAITEWSEDNFPKMSPTGKPLPPGVPPLVATSLYVRATPLASYFIGPEILAELDGILEPVGGLLPVLKDFYAEYQGKTYTTDNFITTVNRHARKDLTEFFNSRLYGSPDIQRSK